MKKKLKMDKKILEDNSPTLPWNYGEIMAKKHMKEFKDKVIDSFDESELNPKFVEEVQNTEKQESILVKDIRKYRK